MNAVIYARVSTKEQEKEGYSIPAQLKLLRDYAANHGMTVVKEYTDSETAKKVGRTSFKLMLDDLEEGLAQIVLVEKTDRLTRNFKDYVAIDDLINLKNIEVHLVKENEALGPNAKSQTKFLHGIRVLMAKNYIDNLSEEVKKGMYEKAEQGHFPTNPPYGYKNNRETKVIDVNEEEAPFVKRAFELYATGNYSLTQVAEKMLQEGFRFREKKPRIQKGTLESMLKNIFYTGDFLLKGKFYHGKHTPLVSLTLFKQTQEAFRRGNKPKLVKREFAFAGLMTCGHCGCSISGQLQRNRYIYYHCTGGRGKCSDPYIREEKIAEQFEAALKAVTLKEEDLDWIIPQLKQHHQDEIRFYQSRVSDLQKRQKKLLERLDLMYEDRLDGTITNEFWEAKQAQYKTELRQIETALSQHTKSNLDYVESGIRILELAKNAYQLYSESPPLEQRRILNFVLSNITLKAGKVRYDYRLPFNLIAESNKTGEWWAIGDLNTGPHPYQGCALAN